jgi:FkbM family methyltransferase
VTDESVGPQILRAFGDVYPSATFIEIGANDGVQYDQLGPLIRSLPWRGVMVEPVPWLFERLRRNYRDRDGVAFENAAIGAADGMVPFHYVAPPDDRRPDDSPTWSDAMGSLSRFEVEQTLAATREYAAKGSGAQIPDLSSRIETIEVASLTFDSLCRKHRIEGLDLLQIDAEGYDWEIIKGIDFSRHRPRLLIYEHNHLSAEERERCRAFLEGLGYETRHERIDTWCHDPRADDELARSWRRFRPKSPGALGMALHRLRSRVAPRRG